MPFRVMVLGGYGNFGARIARRLAQDALIEVIIAGKNSDAACAYAEQLNTAVPPARVTSVTCDIQLTPSLIAAINQTQCNLVINTVGPFQGQDFCVATAVITAGVDYLDLADAREYVQHFQQLDELARKHKVLAVTGASTVPGLSAAVIDHYLPEFAKLASIDIGISPGNRAPRGLATIRAVLSYCGQPLTQFRHGQWQTVYGWQGLVRRRYPNPMHTRWLSYCDVPDLLLFPERYPAVRTVIFRAGMELTVIQLGIWLLSWLARWRIVKHWPRYAKLLRSLSDLLLPFGSDVGGMHVELSGVDHHQRPLRITWHVIAQQNDGPEIPCTAAVVIAQQLARGQIKQLGARPCLDLFSLDAFMLSLQGRAIQQQVSREELRW
jgi:hypothetical protein